MPAAGETIIAGRIPGERIATSIETSNSANITTTETEVQTVTAAVVTGRTYRVRWSVRVSSSVAADDITLRIREDSLTGTILQSETMDVNVSNREPRVTLEAEYTADATEDKVFSATLVRTAGTGNVILNAATTVPTYLYVDYIRG